MATLGSLVARFAERVREAVSTETASSREEAAAPGARALPVRRIVTQAAALWLVSRALLVLLWQLALAFGLALPNRQTGPLSPQIANAHGSLLPWLHWDAVWYVTIATRGYDFQSQLAPGGIPVVLPGFFPLYPLLIHGLTLALGVQQAVLAALLVSNGA